MRQGPAFRIYNLLLERFGPRGWWPVTPPGALEPAYHPRRKTFRPPDEGGAFEIAVGAILTQNTAWANVRKALMELNRRRLMSPERLLRAPFSSLAKAVRPSGYFRQKAKKLKVFSRFLQDRHGGRMKELLSRPLSQARSELLKVHGIGPETADSILLYAGARPIFVVDAYTRRIGGRVGLFRTEDYEKARAYFETALEGVPLKERAGLFGEYHALLVELGKNLCRPRPLCWTCPLQRACRTGRRKVRA
ncbi:MAG: hypothetical protein A2902_06680 [Elusimicrobia bacterium RIFCSPLOWO2_01_FULL_64_13]|nr:MAG: hypothetical protein A2636_03810 [Elusimicrobia bacterium RIFCSPHIGHO2_01_FULL_64_10]OGR97629.1 MAG: hypothetical protein A2902_06680 [Elusimicrobia bacterium RIFCSPLOWO2_01_FULL_64_13]